MRGGGGVAGEGRELLMYQSFILRPSMNINSDLMSNASSALAVYF